MDYWFLFGITTLLLAIHLVLVNLAMVGPLVCVWFKERAQRGDAAADQLGWKLARHAVMAYLIGMFLGLGLAGLAWLDRQSRFFAGLAAIPQDRVLWGLAELGFSLGCLLAYALLWRRAVGIHRGWHHLLALLASTNLLYHFPPLFLAVSMLSAVSGPLESLDASGFLRMMIDPEVLARWLHHAIAAIAATGCYLMLLRVSGSQPGGSVDEKAVLRPAVVGGRIALAATLLQIPIGLWVLLEVPQTWRDRMLGGDLVATAYFVGSMLVAFGLLHLLATASLGETSRPKVLATAFVFFLVVLFMTATVRYCSNLPRPDKTFQITNLKSQTNSKSQKTIPDHQPRNDQTAGSRRRLSLTRNSQLSTLNSP